MQNRNISMTNIVLVCALMIVLLSAACGETIRSTKNHPESAGAFATGKYRC